MNYDNSTINVLSNKNMKSNIKSSTSSSNNKSTSSSNDKIVKINNKIVKINNKINSDNDNDNDFEVIYRANTLRCSRCKTDVNKEWKFCNQCGNNLTLMKPTLTKASMKALDFIEKVDRDSYLNKSTYSSIVIDNNSSSKINQYNDSIDDEYDNDNDDNTLSIDEKVLNAIDDRINSFNSDAYKKYKKKLVLAEMLADELELQNAEFIESAYIAMVNDYKKSDDGEMLNDFIL